MQAISPAATNLFMCVVEHLHSLRKKGTGDSKVLAKIVKSRRKGRVIYETGRVGGTKQPNRFTTYYKGPPEVDRDHTKNNVPRNASPQIRREQHITLASMQFCLWREETSTHTGALPLPVSVCTRVSDQTEFSGAPQWTESQ